MMRAATTFPYAEINPGTSHCAHVPVLPVTLQFAADSIEVRGLVDTGAAVNVIPFDVGPHLGLTWENQQYPVRLTGNLLGLESRAVFVNAYVGEFRPIELCFAWTKTNGVPVLLGQVNFFDEFEVCFFRPRLVFEVRPKRTRNY